VVERLTRQTRHAAPPDPSMQAQLDQLMAMVTLIQRQAAPFGYVPGAIQPHWNGSDRDSGPNRCKVDITTLPTQLGA